MAIAIMPDHAHLMISASPNMVPSQIMKHIKRYIVRRLGEGFMACTEERICLGLGLPDVKGWIGFTGESSELWRREQKEII